MKVKQALILAGGYGTRLRPFTNDLPKPMVPVLGKPILQWQVEWLKEYGIEKMIFAVGYQHQKISDYFGDGSKFGIQADYVIENEPLGTAGCLKLAKDKLDEHFLMTNGDEISDLNLDEMQEFHSSRNAFATIFVHEMEDLAGYGIVELDGEKIKRFVEKPDESNMKGNLINGGFYVLDKKILKYIGEGRQSIERDVFPKLVAEGKLHGFRSPRKVFWTTVNTMQQLHESEERLKGRQ